MLSRIGRFFRRLGGDQDRPQDRPPIIEQDQPAEEFSRQQAESDLLAQDVIGRTRPIAVSDRSIHQARSVAVTDTRPMVSPARPQERRDIPTEALPFATPRETLPPVGSISGDTESAARSTFEGDSTGDSEWDALWHLRGTACGSSQPSAPPRMDSVSTASDTPASPPPPPQGSVQRTIEPEPMGGDSLPGDEPAPLVQDESGSEVHRTPAAPAARRPIPRSEAPTVPAEEVRRRPSPRTPGEVPGGERGSVQRQELPGVEAPAIEVRPESIVSAASHAPVQRSSPSAERPAAQPARAPVQESLDESLPAFPAHPAEENEPQSGPETTATPPERAALTQEQAGPGPAVPTQPVIQRQSSVPAKESDVPPPDVAPQPDLSSSTQPATVQPKATEPEPGPVSVPASLPPLQRQPFVETPAGESLVDTSEEAAPPEDAPLSPSAAPTVPSAPPVARAPETTEPIPEPQSERMSAQESTGPAVVPQPERPVRASTPPAATGVQREMEPETAPVVAPESEIGPEPVSPAFEVASPPARTRVPTQVPAAQREEAIEPIRTQPVQREPEIGVAPPAPGLPEAVSADISMVEEPELTPDLVQQHVDRREALRQALQPRIVPAVVQRAVEETETQQAASAGTETGPEAEEGQGPNIEALAKDVYRLLKKKLLVERERDLGRI